MVRSGDIIGSVTCLTPHTHNLTNIIFRVVIVISTPIQHSLWQVTLDMLWNYWLANILYSIAKNQITIEQETINYGTLGKMEILTKFDSTVNMIIKK